VGEADGLNFRRRTLFLVELPGLSIVIFLLIRQRCRAQPQLTVFGLFVLMLPRRSQEMHFHDRARQHPL